MNEPHKDIFGKEILVDDTVVFVRKSSSKDTPLCTGTVIGYTPKAVRIVAQHDLDYDERMIEYARKNPQYNNGRQPKPTWSIASPHKIAIIKRATVTDY
jgi:hypothetical protein